ncbi:MAG: acetyl-CoA carboxylase biotin carboxyl carrier protein subunit [Theionarchaea archaeon]|nr:acetyl-CoA carboxylase biotin carboxyl carrier protein subunit [Theionarchaea archaeon]MBU7038389.1 acetyl-CoA carboxylase biotin carboxyl carrier protein subunit [Theionarchaea archaeon]
MEMYFEHKNAIHKVDVEQRSDAWEIRIGEQVYNVSASQIGEAHLQVSVNNACFQPRVFCNGQKQFVFCNGETYCLKRAIRSSQIHDHVEGEIISPIGGKIVKVFASEGDIVEKGENLVIIESMKMEHRVKAPMKGTVMRLRYGEGAIVDTGEVLVDMEPDRTATGQAEW